MFQLPVVRALFVVIIFTAPSKKINISVVFNLIKQVERHQGRIIPENEAAQFIDAGGLQMLCRGVMIRAVLQAPLASLVVFLEPTTRSNMTLLPHHYLKHDRRPSLRRSPFKLRCQGLSFDGTHYRSDYNK